MSTQLAGIWQGHGPLGSSLEVHDAEACQNCVDRPFAGACQLCRQYAGSSQKGVNLMQVLFNCLDIMQAPAKTV
jgi:hypothetical protein